MGGTLTKNISYTFDANGNRTQRYDSIAPSTTNYTYDQADRLTSAGMYAYAYNGDGLRMSKSSLQTTQYTWDIGVEAGLPLLLQDKTGSYIYGPGGMLLEDVVGTSSTDVYYYHGDRQGSVRALTSSTGAVSNTYTYDAYGKTLTSTGSVSNPFKYTGEYTDQESGFIYLRARYYDPESQQFLTVDPALAWTEEAYAYVSGNPINLRDPWGLDGCGMFPNFFDANSCVRKGLDTEAGKWVAGVGVVAAGGVVIICIASGVCEVAAAGAAVVGGAEAGVAAEGGIEESVERGAEEGETCATTYVYRGVHADHPEIEAARRGSAIPGDINGIVTPDEHNMGMGAQAESPFTSWTTDFYVARFHAIGRGPGGVILRVPFGDPPPGATWRWVESPDTFQEAEILLWGVRHGAEVLSP